MNKIIKNLFFQSPFAQIIAVLLAAQPFAFAQPVITNMSPVFARPEWVDLIVDGREFQSGSIVTLDEASVPTQFISDFRLAANFEANSTNPAPLVWASGPITPRLIRVQNPDGQISDPRVFSLVGYYQNVVDAHGVWVAPGGSGNASVRAQANISGLRATLSVDSTSLPAVLSIASIPDASLPKTLTDVGGGDISLEMRGSASQISVDLYYPTSISGDIENGIKVYFWGGSSWNEVRGTGDSLPQVSTFDNLDQTVSGGRFRFILDASSSPSVDILGLVYFKVALPPLPPTGMSTKRLGHTATSLGDGRVLFVGGSRYENVSGWEILSSFEIYDPAQDVFTSAGQSGVPRRNHSATFISSTNKVLIVGGDSQIAELYDPITESVEGLRSLYRHFGHTAVELWDQRVLLADGNSEGNVEIFNPQDNSFQEMGMMAEPLYYRQATLLANGQVLFTGGYYSRPFSSVEVFDPNYSGFYSTFPLSLARAGHTATLLLSGEVLITGDGNVPTAKTELLITNSVPLDLGVARSANTATRLLDGRVLIVGGRGHDGFLASAELFVPGPEYYGGSFAFTGNLSIPRAGHTATLLPSGKVLIAGGENADGLLSTAELYDPATGLFTPTVGRRAGQILAFDPPFVQSGSPEITLQIKGVGFQPESYVSWNGMSMSPNFISPGLLQLTVASSNLFTAQDIETVAVTVVNRNGFHSNQKGFVIAAGTVSNVETVTSPGGTTTTLNNAPTISGASGAVAILTNDDPNPTDGDPNTAVVTIANYPMNPTPSDALFDVGGGFIDLNVNGADAGDRLTATFYYPEHIVGTEETELQLKFFTGIAWEPVLGSGGTLPTKDLTDSVNGTISGGFFTVNFDNTSVPKITELTGTVFTMALDPKDTVPPTIKCADVTLACSVEGLVPVAYPSPIVTDNTDPAPTVKYSIPSGSGFKAGTTVVTSTATDASGNSSSTTFKVVREALAFQGFLPPIGGADATGGSPNAPLKTFKLNSTIPVKFSLSCGGAPVTTGVHTLQLIKQTTSTTSDAPIDATPQEAATTGKQFVLGDNLWHLNLKTREPGLTVGIWQFIATLSDGSTHRVWVQLK